MDAKKSIHGSFGKLSPKNKGADDKTAASKNVLPEKEIIENLPEMHIQIPSSGDSDSDSDDDSASGSREQPCDVLGNGQLMKRIIRKSPINQKPSRGELITISFTGKLLDSDLIVEKFHKLQIHVGDFEVVQGLDMILPLMNVGETCEVIVDARFAYGSLGLKNDDKPELSIPPETNIKYKVHLHASVMEDLADLRSFELRKKYGAQKKERANFWYNRNEYSTAIELYKRALDYLDDDPDTPSSKDNSDLSKDEVESLLEDRIIVYNNLAMAQIKISAFNEALESVDNVLHCQPDNSKALYRKGKILDAKGDTKRAINCLQKAASLESDDKAIQQDLAKLLIKARREENIEKELYQKMLGHARKLEQKNKLTRMQQSPDSSKLKFLSYVMGFVLIGVAGVAIYRYKY